MTAYIVEERMQNADMPLHCEGAIYPYQALEIFWKRVKMRMRSFGENDYFEALTRLMREYLVGKDGVCRKLYLNSNTQSFDTYIFTIRTVEIREEERVTAPTDASDLQDRMDRINDEILVQALKAMPLQVVSPPSVEHIGRSYGDFDLSKQMTAERAQSFSVSGTY